MLNKKLEGAYIIGIAGHIHPDGDCVGSCLGMYNYIKENYPDKKVYVFLEELTERFSFLDKEKECLTESVDIEFDLFISLDCATKDRLGFAEVMFDCAKDTFCVDHHISNQGYAKCNFIDPDASSASELVYRLVDMKCVSKKVASCLYMGIAHDSGVFQYSCAGPETFRAAADLIEAGINATEIVESTYYEKTFAQQQILGYSLCKSKLVLNDTCIVSYLTEEDMKQYRVSKKDLDGIVSQLRLTKNVETSIFLYQIDEDLYKLSLRAGDKIDVNKVANVFGGGGHIKAAGATISGEINTIIARIISEIEKQYL